MRGSLEKCAPSSASRNNAVSSQTGKSSRRHSGEMLSSVIQIREVFNKIQNWIHFFLPFSIFQSWIFSISYWKLESGRRPRDLQKTQWCLLQTNRSHSEGTVNILKISCDAFKNITFVLFTLPLIIQDLFLLRFFDLTFFSGIRGNIIALHF